ncbi:MAG: amidoligase family protein [Bacilli bacterium]
MSNILEGNNQVSKLKNLDLKQFLFELKNVSIEYQEILNISKETTFGIEIEFVEANFEDINKNLIENWRLKNDPSVSSIIGKKKVGGEINSPILKDNITSWQEIKQVCEMLKENNASISPKCGGHVHIGQQDIETNIESWKNLLKLWAAYENIIYRFSSPEQTSIREKASTFASPIRYDIITKIGAVNRKNDDRNIPFLIQFFGHDRNQGINFCNTDFVMKRNSKKTIEFRCPNGTLNPVVWQNNINLFYHLLKSVNNQNFDIEKVNHRISNIDLDLTDIYFYNEIYLKESLELADLIFDNNKDKCYFLKQYINDFKTDNSYIKYKEY